MSLSVYYGLENFTLSDRSKIYEPNHVTVRHVSDGSDEVGPGVRIETMEAA